jgi:Fic family protein
VLTEHDGMNPADFHAPEVGRLVEIAHGGYAFVPEPLPPAINYTAELVLRLSRADQALSELSGLGRHLPNPHILIAPYVKREAVLSSRIEGTRTNMDELLRDEIENQGEESGDSDVREVRNYVAALEHGIKRMDKLPLSLRLVRELHARLMKGVRGDTATPGEFRRSQNWIGRAGSTIMTATYVPPPPQVMMEALGQWERFLHEREAMPDLVQCALMHEQFEAIHPFLDGNGRVGRLLITLFLIERGRLSQPLLYLSEYIERNRQDYYELLQRVRTHGDWHAWLVFFLAGVAETANKAVAQAGRLMDLREASRARLKASPRALALLDELFTNPYTTVTHAATVLKVSNPTARQAVAALERAGMLEEVSGRTWGKLYLARPIMQVIEN